jgi:hypothetical protein
MGSFLAHTFTDPCFGYEPKARVVTMLEMEQLLKEFKYVFACTYRDLKRIPP